jgi:3'-phosphoadenosine 5'-phosphosulfate sulfotransferase (PAPS reductase)/FAD synthetase
VKYCSLYDEGYTSIGAVTDTLPNVSLKRADGSYSPAYDLVDGTQERNGRGAPSCQSTVPVSPVKTKKGSVGICIVGSEILSGKVRRSAFAHSCERGVYEISFFEKRNILHECG